VIPVALLLPSCGGSPAGQAESPEEGEGIARQAVAPVTVVAYDAEELAAQFERARSHLLMERYAEAAKNLDHLRLLAKGSELGALSVYHAGMAHEGLGDLERALTRYRELGREYPDAPVLRNGLIRQTRLLGALERWAELGETADELLRRGAGLPVMDRIEALGAKALSLVEQGQIDAAQRYVTRARDIIEEKRFGEAGAPPPQLAQVAFAQGEITRHRSEQIRLIPVPPNFAEVLEQRCQGLLDAQSAYTEAMRSRDSYWSAMAGYRVGQLYRDLHAEAMRIPAPDTARTLRQKQLFEGAMRLRYRILLDKGLKMMAATVRMGERTGEPSPWIGRARRAQDELERALADEKAALAKLPYTEAELRAALDELKQRAQEEAKNPR
jgi:tetratricopeptide (TPR) repeat protein